MQRTQWQDHLSPLVQQLMSAQPNDHSTTKQQQQEHVHDDDDERRAAKPEPSIQQVVPHHHLPKWLRETYTNVWLYKLKNNDKSSMLEMKELITRPIDVESPLWYMLPMNKKEINNDEYRLQMWTAIRSELYKTLKRKSPSSSKRKLNLYTYHNVAVLSFHIGNRSDAFELMDMLIDRVFNAVFLRTMAYFYIQSNQLTNGAVILYHLLNRQDESSDDDEDGVDYHAMYLSMRLLTQHMEETEETDDLLEFRNCVMRCLCVNKPNHHLYKLWAERWLQETANMNVEVEELSVNDAVQDISQLLKQMLGEKTEGTTTEEDNVQQVDSELSLEQSNRPQVSLVRQFIDRLKLIFSDYKLLMQLIGTILSIVGVSLFVRAIRRWFNRGQSSNTHRYNPMFQSILQDFYQSVESDSNALTPAVVDSKTQVRSSEPLSFDENDNAMNVVQLRNKPDMESNGTRTILRPQLISEKVADKSPDDIENERVVLSDYEYADNLYREISDFTKRALQKKEVKPVMKDSKPKQQGRKGVPTVTTLTGSGGVIPTNERTNLVNRIPTQKRSLKKTTTTPPVVTNKNVKVFGSKNRK